LRFSQEGGGTAPSFGNTAFSQSAWSACGEILSIVLLILRTGSIPGGRKSPHRRRKLARRWPESGSQIPALGVRLSPRPPVHGLLFRGTPFFRGRGASPGRIAFDGSPRSVPAQRGVRSLADRPDSAGACSLRSRAYRNPRTRAFLPSITSRGEN